MELRQLPRVAARETRWRLTYVGRKHLCPCCGARLRNFAPHHRGRPNAVCPRCGAAERHRLLWLYLQREIGITTMCGSVLHLSPEPMIARKLEAEPSIEYTSADLDPDAAMIAADITDLPFADGSFDLILCSHVLEHVADDSQAFSELFRVLKPEGRALLMHPIDYSRETYEDASITTPQDRKRAFLQEDHVRVYGRDFPARVEAEGFDVRLDRYVDRVGGLDVEKFGLRTRSVTPSPNATADDIYVCTKPAG